MAAASGFAAVLLIIVKERVNDRILDAAVVVALRNEVLRRLEIPGILHCHLFLLFTNATDVTLCVSGGGDSRATSPSWSAMVQ